ncbi:MAG: Ig domain-containing protein [Candidatus Nanopelagicaceae bacterium]
MTVNTAATGFTISSTGGVIASFAISPAAPAGMSFDTSTGAFSGTPTATQSATTYTITATNATGSATKTFSFTVSAAVISVAAIGGVTAPVTDATPVTTVTAANGYTGTVTWSGSPTTFAAATTYTATITLTADDGYTLTGVSENFFTVAGATSVTHSANSGVITAVFPATEFYAIGGTGPGGGTIFYVAETDFNCGPSLTLSCRYLEAAPITGSTAWTDAGYQWSGNVTTRVDGALQTGIGTGYSNTLAIVAQSSTAERAATKAQSYRGPNNLSDWYLPSQNELYQMLGIVPLDGRYWTSTQIDSASANARLYIFNISISPNTASLGGGSKTQPNKVRPIRAFGGP